MTTDSNDKSFKVSVDLSEGVHKIYATQVINGNESTKTADRFITVGKANGNPEYLQSIYSNDKTTLLLNDPRPSFDVYEKQIAELNKDKVTVMVNGRLLQSDVEPFIENGRIIENDIEYISHLKASGISVVTLTWNAENSIGGGASSKNVGITSFGKEVLKSLEDNRIVIEVDSDTSVSIDFCIAMSRHIESELNRDVEDFELEVGSSGLTEPFKLTRQYVKNIGNEVEVLTCDGRKLKGILKNANEEGFILETERDVKLEGAKRKTRIKEEEQFNYQDIKYTKYLIRFK